ncbi:VBCS repeat-containing protein OS=Isosphaera pallida (strain ATCC 43644 / DSM 9630 / IS1B) GN=Isop_0876 PE=4 SV=1 [Gemmata massiliana]|uniref:VBCS repeat-containing protein n=1 Tax=Gemmata massiliana TaxID=1210884 RepID=A0A6P2CZY4_9BACT|nr:hypothetical protein [Gemmata massiliana]VTR92770.1 VBCS repeat-containing protein OS=Isosphaera pallida (strain ATCC 43644 / DSM 9630 / IS1B) GN=Isop_0876 PE=4 SV=1 [Gemmata massiliana]
MKKLLSKFFGGEARPRPTRPASGFRPSVEALEGRALMSVVGPELHVNSITSLNQDQVAVASSPAPGGGSVVAWRHQYSTSGTDTDIHVQRYDQLGNKLGGEITVAANFDLENQPSVAMDRAGNFVVVWVDNINNSGNTNVLAQRFLANGTRNGGVIAVANDARAEYDPDVAMDAAGNFAVSYTFQFSATDSDVYVHRFAANGASIGTTLVAASGLNEYSGSIARTADGRFAVAYQIDHLSGRSLDSDVMLNQYAANGTLQTSRVIANTTRVEISPDVAVDAFGNATVVYEEVFANLDHDIKARQVSSTGVLGAPIFVDLDTDYEFAPVVAVNPSTDNFVVSYQRLHNNGTRLDGPNQLIVREMNANGSVRGTTNLGDRFGAALGMNGSGTYFLGAAGFGLPGDQGIGIAGRRGVLN